jgi:hypothetical protein
VRRFLNASFGIRVIVSPNIFPICRGRDGRSASLPFSEVFGVGKYLTDSEFLSLMASTTEKMESTIEKMESTGSL